MERISMQIADVWRFKPTGRMLAMYQNCNGRREVGFLVVDEARREIACTGTSYSQWDTPDHVHVRRKADLGKIRDSKEKRALIDELNRKIVWSNLDAVGAVLERVIEIAFDLVPLDRSGLRVLVDQSAIEHASPELKALGRIAELVEVAERLLANATDTDARALKRFALRAPYGADEAAA